MHYKVNIMADMSYNVEDYIDALRPFDPLDNITIVDTGANIRAFLDTLTVAQIEALLTTDFLAALVITDTSFSLTVEQFRSLHSLGSPVGINIFGIDEVDPDPNNPIPLTVTLADTGANLSSLTPDEVLSLAGRNIDTLNANGDTIILTGAELSNLVGGVTLSAGDTVVLESPAADFVGADFSGLDDLGIDIIRVTEADGQMALSYAVVQTFGDLVVAAEDTVTMTITDVELEALSSTEITALSAQGVDILDLGDTTADLTVAQALAVANNAMSFAAGNVVTIVDDADGVGGLTVLEIDALHALGVVTIDVEGDAVVLAVEQALELVAKGIALSTLDAVTLIDTAGNLVGLSADNIAALRTLGVVTIDVSGDGALTLSKVQFDALGTITLKAADTITVTMNVAEFQAAVLADLKAKGADVVDVGGADLPLDAAGAKALADSDLTLAAGVVTISDTGTAIAGISAGQITALATAGVDVIDVSGDGALSLSFAQFDALDTIALTDGDAVTLTVSDDEFAGLDLTTLAGLKIDVLKSDDTLTLSLAQLEDLGTVTLVAADTVTLTLTADELQALDADGITALVAKGIDVLDVGVDALAFDADQAKALAASGLTLTAGVVTISDTGTAIAGISAGQITALVAAGVDVIDVSGDGALSLSFAQFDALDTIALTDGDTVTLTVSDDEFAGLDLTTLAGLKIDVLKSDGTLTLSLAQLEDLGTVTLVAADTVTLTLTADELQALDADGITALVAKGIDVLDVGVDALTFDAVEAKALANSGVALTAGVVTISDTGGNIDGISVGQITALVAAGVDAIDVSGDGLLTLSKAQYDALGAIALTADDTVTVMMNAGEFAALGNAIGALDDDNVDFIEISGDGVLALTKTQYDLLGTTKLAAANTVTLTLTGDELHGLDVAHITALGTSGVDVLDVSGAGAVTLSKAQYDVLGTVALTQTDTVTLALTADELGGLDTTAITALANKGVDITDVSGGGAVTLTAAQVALWTAANIKFAADDVVTMTDTAAHLSGLSEAAINALKTQGVDMVDSDGPLTLTAEKLALWATAGVAFATNDSVTLEDTADNVADLDFADLGATQIDLIDVLGDGKLTLTAANAGALALTAISVATNDVITVNDAGAAIGGLSVEQITGLAAKNVATIDASDGTLSLSVAQAKALGSVALTQGDVVTLADTGVALGGLDAEAIKNLAAKGVDAVDSNTGSLALSLGQTSALATNHVSLNAADVVSVADTGGAIGGLTATQITALATQGVDVLDASNNALTLNASQAVALTATGMSVTAGDAVNLTDTGAALSALTVAQLGALAGKGVDVVDASDNKLVFSSAQLAALGTLSFAAGDSLSVNGTAGVDNLTGTSGNDLLFGLAGNDRLSGGLGDDRLYGGAGKDTLTGFTGKDIFVFNTKLNKTTNLDKIADFNVKDDSIWLDNAIFTKLGKKGSEAKPVKLSSKFFTVGEAAKDGNDLIIYNKKKGVILYDADGNGAHKAVEVATTTKNLKINYNDFFIV